ncbi:MULTISPECIES: hypothetical protein [Bacteria]|uniref:hypothetical protein n=1 Tax=Bacteria TaxID=2 RepID=UPI003C7E2F24
MRRRTIVKGAAWSIPVIAAVTAVPFASASVAFTLTATLTSALTACGTAPLELLLKDAQGAPVSGPVTVSLPAGLTWDDGTTADKVVTTDANGRATLTVKGTGQGGTFTITGQGLAPTPTSPAQAVATVAAVGGRIFHSYTSGITDPVNSDPNGTVPNPVEVRVSNNGGTLSVRTADGGWYHSSPIGVGGTPTWNKVDAPPIVSLISTNFTSGSYTQIGLTADGDVYRSYEGQPATQISSPVKFTEIFSTGGFLYGVTADGKLYATKSHEYPFMPVTTNTGAPFPTVTELSRRESDAIQGNSFTVIADGKVYSQTSGGLTTPPSFTPYSPGPLNPTDVINHGSINGVYPTLVLDADGSLWVGDSSNPSIGLQQVNVAGLPPLDSFISRVTTTIDGTGATGVLARATDGRMVFVKLSATSTRPTVTGVVDVTPTGFSMDDIVETDVNGNDQIAVRLSNGDVWTLRNGVWTKLTLPSGATDLAGSNGNGVGYIVSGDVACS